MRKILSLIVALVAVSAWATDFSVDGVYYSTLSENTVQVVAPPSGKYTGAIVVPANTVQKVLIDGVLYIIRDGKAFNAQGAQV